MSDDLLSQFTSALADEHDGATAVPEATRARVIRTLAEKRRRGRKWWAVGIPALAIFGGSTAWAAATGRLPLPAVVEKAVAVFVEKAPEPASPRKPAQLGATHGASSKTPEVITPTEQEHAEPAAKKPVITHEASPKRPAEVHAAPAAVNAPPASSERMNRTLPTVEAKKSTASHPSAPASSAPADAPLVDQALLTYRSAHRAQFQSGNCAEAIAGYERYLREDPSGSFALEAKYNRGVCLAKMGQTSSAIQALRPFADGKYGTYRQEKSRALIEALGQ